VYSSRPKVTKKCSPTPINIFMVAFEANASSPKKDVSSTTRRKRRKQKNASGFVFVVVTMKQ